MYKAKEIAYWFLAKNYGEQKMRVAVNDEFDVYEYLTHQKLQKLLYYAQGCSLAINNEPLFDEPIEAWEHGPIISSIYDMFYTFRQNPLVIPASEEYTNAVTKIEEDAKTRKLLEFVYENFAIYTAWELRNMTHESKSPWLKANKTHDIIDNEAIKEYFKKEVLEDEDEE